MSELDRVAPETATAAGSRLELLPLAVIALLGWVVVMKLLLIALGGVEAQEGLGTLEPGLLWGP